MIINLLIDTKTKEVQVSIPKGYNTLRVCNLINIFFISYIKRNIPKFAKEIAKVYGEKSPDAGGTME